MTNDDLKLLMQQAEQGDMQAQYVLGMKYFYAEGVEEDHSRAAQLLEQAAEQGHREAAYNLGICYHYGYGVELDLKTAYQLYLRSALQGYGKGFNLVGDFYAEGICVRQNYREAIKWYLDATVNEDLSAVSYAEYKLAGFLANGCGVEQDPEQAVVWYEKALSHGESRARAELERLGYYETFQVRTCRIEDAQGIGMLNQQELGHPIPPNLTERLQTILDAETEQVFVAVSEGKIVGYIHGSEEKSLFGNSRKRIAGMAVSQSQKDLGIEQKLLERLAQWAAKSESDLVICQETILKEASVAWKKLFG